MEPQPFVQKQVPVSHVPDGGIPAPIDVTDGLIAPEAPGAEIIGPPEPKQASKIEDVADDGAAEPDPPFSIFSRREKTFLVVMASLAALFSPLSANIYYPALNVLAADLNVSNTLINLTITSYLVRQ